MTHYICWGLEDLRLIWRLRTTCSTNYSVMIRQTECLNWYIIYVHACHAMHIFSKYLGTMRTCWAYYTRTNRPPDSSLQPRDDALAGPSWLPFPLGAIRQRRRRATIMCTVHSAVQNWIQQLPAELKLRLCCKGALLFLLRSSWAWSVICLLIHQLMIRQPAQHDMLWTLLLVVSLDTLNAECWSMTRFWSCLREGTTVCRDDVPPQLSKIFVLLLQTCKTCWCDNIINLVKSPRCHCQRTCHWCKKGTNKLEQQASELEHWAGSAHLLINMLCQYALC